MNKTVNDLTKKILEQNFWTEFAPQMSISTQMIETSSTLNEVEQKKYYAKLLKEGYAHIKSPESQVNLSAIVDVFEALDEIGLPPVFAFIYDETWLLNTQLKSLLSSVLDNNYYLLPDFWAWLVKPGEAGWTPHRDKPKGASPRPNVINSVTVWLPLTEAHPQIAACMFYPLTVTPMYGELNPQPGFPGQLADIRALPAMSGDILIWTQQILHWGAHSADSHSMKPRMNIAFEYQRSDIPAYNQPLLEPNSLLSFESRISLIARMIMQYRGMYKLHRRFITDCAFNEQRLFIAR